MPFPSLLDFKAITTTVVSILMALAGCAIPCALAAETTPTVIPTELAVKIPSLPNTDVLRFWIGEMKQAPRGPFGKISWFCKDGTIYPAKPYACTERGGGIQHGQWNDRIKLLRANGYLMANILAEIKPEEFLGSADATDALRQILLERFLMQADDGWVFRKALTYRGALQQEDEVAAGRALLLAMFKDKSWRTVNFSLLREAVRLLPHGRPDSQTTLLRQLSTTLAEKDTGFKDLRIKLHNNPDAGDAQLVRNHAATSAKTELVPEYEKLAQLIDAVFTPPDLIAALKALSPKITSARLKGELEKSTLPLTPGTDSLSRFAALGQLLKLIRDQLDGAGSPFRMLALTEISLLAEREMFTEGSLLRQKLGTLSRQKQLTLLWHSSRGLYGLGLLSDRQLDALDQSAAKLSGAPPSPESYHAELLFQSRISSWASNTLHFLFSPAITPWAEIEPKAKLYISDRLRSSPLLAHMDLLDTLLNDAAGLLGLRHQIFGQPLTGGIRALNPGLARVPLLEPPSQGHSFSAEGIYILPETEEETSALSGIVTTGSGNLLSHSNLLARNLGVPNISVEERLLHLIKTATGRKVVLAVSPQGRVRLELDSPAWNSVFEKENQAPDLIIRPDVSKLDLHTLEFIPLSRLETADSGRVVGPKAANLGELKKHFPDAVTEGLAIPFGHFRKLLEQPMEPGGPSIFEWMRSRYAEIAAETDPQRKSDRINEFLKKLRWRIVTADPGETFRNNLKKQMEQVFGPEGTYGVFVRSDTNIEDLPGFTGAGLNLTLPNVIGFDNILKALLRVWGSPFTERSYSWRQGRMENPEQVYSSVLLLKSVPSEKSGVMVTQDITTGDASFLTLAVSEGIGGAVAGQRAEELLVNRKTGEIRLLNQASEPYKRVLSPQGGVTKIPASGSEQILNPAEIETLRTLALQVETRFPEVLNRQGQPLPADIEFGFTGGKLVLFQIRPFSDNVKTRQSDALRHLDRSNRVGAETSVDIYVVPEVIR